MLRVETLSYRAQMQGCRDLPIMSISRSCCVTCLEGMPSVRDTGVTRKTWLRVDRLFEIMPENRRNSDILQEMVSVF